MIFSYAQPPYPKIAAGFHVLMNDVKVFLLHNEISPYRLPLFERLSEEVDLTVYFCESKSSHRKWNEDLSGYRFSSFLGKRVHLGPLIINYDLLSALAQEDYDVYLVGGLGVKTFFSSLLTYVVSRFRKGRYILWSGYVNTDFYRAKKPFKGWFGKIVRGYLARNSDAVISYSEMNEKYLVSLGVSREKIFRGGQVMPEPLLEDPVGDEEEDTSNDDKVTVLSLGYFKPEKGIDYLIRAYKGLSSELRKKSELVIAGAGSEESRLKKLSKGENDIRLPGYVEGEEKRKLFQRAAIFVLPTLHDPWGLVINEAMHYSLPVITTQAAGAKELISDNGIVVSPGDKSDLREALSRLIKDEGLRTRMGQKSREYIKGVNTESAVGEFMKAIEYSLA